MRKVGRLLIISTALVCALAADTRCQSLSPSASLEIDSGSLLKALGFSLVEATVALEGKLYRVRLYGISPGANGYHASGKVYGLKNIDDIVGRYESLTDYRVFVSESGVEIVVNAPFRLKGSGLYVDYLGPLYARHDQSVQFGPH